MVHSVRKLEPAAAAASEDLLALEREMTPSDDADLRRELQVLREVFHGDREAELRAWKAGTHPLHPNPTRR